MDTLAKTKEPKDKAPVQRCIDAFFNTFVSRFGFKPQIKGGKDGAHIKSLIATWGEQEVLDIISAFFRTTDPRVLRSDYSIGALYSLAQHVRLRGMKIADPRTAENLDAANRATQSRH